MSSYCVWGKNICPLIRAVHCMGVRQWWFHCIRSCSDISVQVNSETTTMYKTVFYALTVQF